MASSDVKRPNYPISQLASGNNYFFIWVLLYALLVAFNPNLVSLALTAASDSTKRDGAGGGAVS